jgi:hypothetical protein
MAGILCQFEQGQNGGQNIAKSSVRAQSVVFTLVSRLVAEFPDLVDRGRSAAGEVGDLKLSGRDAQIRDESNMRGENGDERTDEGSHRLLQALQPFPLKKAAANGM